MPDLFDGFEENQPPKPPKAKRYGTDPHKLARTESPETSKAAAESIDTTRLERLVHETIAKRQHRGATADDVIRDNPGLAYSSLTARFSALERKGLIKCGPDKRPGRSGRGQRVMRSIVDPA